MERQQSPQMTSWGLWFLHLHTFWRPVWSSKSTSPQRTGKNSEQKIHCQGTWTLVGHRINSFWSSFSSSVVVAAVVLPRSLSRSSPLWRGSVTPPGGSHSRRVDGRRRQGCDRYTDCLAACGQTLPQLLSLQNLLFAGIKRGAGVLQLGQMLYISGDMLACGRMKEAVGVSARPLHHGSIFCINPLQDIFGSMVFSQ